MDKDYFIGGAFGGCCGCERTGGCNCTKSGGGPCDYLNDMVTSYKHKLTAAIIILIIFLIGVLILLFIFIVYYYRFGDVFHDNNKKFIKPFQKIDVCKITSTRCPVTCNICPDDCTRECHKQQKTE